MLWVTKYIFAMLYFTDSDERILMEKTHIEDEKHKHVKISVDMISSLGF